MFHVRVTKIDPLNYGFEYLGMFADSHIWCQQNVSMQMAMLPHMWQLAKEKYVLQTII
jgi:hypothetical protein